MLCMPVKNSKNEIISALQMINKKNGVFDEEDISILEMFCEMASSAIQNQELFNRTMEERAHLLSILNSMKSYVIVFNRDGHLNYCN
jgi:GAF domain-containing protein